MSLQPGGFWILKYYTETICMVDEIFQTLIEFSPAYVLGTENFHRVTLLSNFYLLGAKKNMIFTGVG